MSGPSHVEVRCHAAGSGWLCDVTVGDDPDATRHLVEVAADDLARLGGDEGVERLVEASVAFLLEREPRESILRRFALPTIGRYFPEYEAEIRRRL